MPYVPEAVRRYLENNSPDSAGELNYTLTKLVAEYLDRQPPVTYQRYNDVIGALECAKLECYRRVVAPYEDTAIDRNGDVY